jgi:hypothetical protein
MYPRTLQHVIDSSKINQACFPEIKKIEEEWSLYNQSGFELKAREIKPKLLFARAAKELGNPIIFKRPNFVEYKNTQRIPLIEIDYDDRKIGFDDPCLFEVEPGIFKGTVPIQVLKTTVAAKKLGFKPYVWFAAKERSLEEVISRPVQRLDPAIVGYPIVAEESGHPIINNEFGLVVGIWGKDIDSIDKVFQENFSGCKL